MAKEFSFLIEEQMNRSTTVNKQEPQVRILRVLEYVGPRDMVYRDLENRFIKAGKEFPICVGKGSLKEISLEEVEFLGEDSHSGGGSEDYNPGDFGLG